MREQELPPEADLRNMMMMNAPAQRMTDPCIMVIFGGAGDLTKRKLVPALCNLAEQGFLPQQFAITAIVARQCRSPTTHPVIPDFFPRRNGPSTRVCPRCERRL